MTYSGKDLKKPTCMNIVSIAQTLQINYTSIIKKKIGFKQKKKMAERAYVCTPLISLSLPHLHTLV